MTFSRLLKDIRACTHCARHIPCTPRPVLQASPSALLRIIGQAPGRKVHETGIPWNDRSGERLRQWLGITPEVFYDAQRVALVPMGFCYPGSAASGDNPPRPECAPRWHVPLNKHLSNVKLTLLIGQYAQAYYLKDNKKTLTETVTRWRDYLSHGFLPLPHPSPRNVAWFKKNKWFEKELVPELRSEIDKLGL